MPHGPTREKFLLFGYVISEKFWAFVALENQAPAGHFRSDYFEGRMTTKELLVDEAPVEEMALYDPVFCAAFYYS